MCREQFSTEETQPAAVNLTTSHNMNITMSFVVVAWKQQRIHLHCAVHSSLLSVAWQTGQGDRPGALSTPPSLPSPPPKRLKVLMLNNTKSFYVT